jgi:RHS repeat-associated protein
LHSHADHLNTPRAIFDENQQLKWRWEQAEPFGVNVPDENPSALGTFEFPVRFPGQYFDKETNLAYNIARNYDGGLARFVESDPIGLRGGVNTYAYVGANPLKWSDSTGLDVDAPVKPPQTPSDTGRGGGGRWCPYAYRLEATVVPFWFFGEKVSAMCYYYCGPKNFCPPNADAYVRGPVWVYDFFRWRYSNVNPCPPEWFFF